MYLYTREMVFSVVDKQDEKVYELARQRGIEQ